MQSGKNKVRAVRKVYKARGSLGHDDFRQSGLLPHEERRILSSEHSSSSAFISPVDTVAREVLKQIQWSWGHNIAAANDKIQPELDNEVHRLASAERSESCLCVCAKRPRLSPWEDFVHKRAADETSTGLKNLECFWLAAERFLQKAIDDFAKKSAFLGGNTTYSPPLLAVSESSPFYPHYNTQEPPSALQLEENEDHVAVLRATERKTEVARAVREGRQMKMKTGYDHLAASLAVGGAGGGAGAGDMSLHDDPRGRGAATSSAGNFQGRVQAGGSSSSWVAGANVDPLPRRKPKLTPGEEAERRLQHAVIRIFQAQRAQLRPKRTRLREERRADKNGNTASRRPPATPDDPDNYVVTE